MEKISSCKLDLRWAAQNSINKVLESTSMHGGQNSGVIGLAFSDRKISQVFIIWRPNGG